MAKLGQAANANQGTDVDYWDLRRSSPCLICLSTGLATVAAVSHAHYLPSSGVPESPVTWLNVNPRDMMISGRAMEETRGITDVSQLDLALYSWGNHPLTAIGR